MTAATAAAALKGSCRRGQLQQLVLMMGQEQLVLVLLQGRALALAVHCQRCRQQWAAA
jgi:hypothetical protein